MRLLRPFANVKPGEGVRVGLMVVCVFLIMTAYYALKTAREGLILAGGTFGLAGDELKAYATGAMALLLVGLVPAYEMLAERQRRMRVLNLLYGIMIVCLIAFYILGRAHVPMGLAYFVWFGLASVFLVAQFWSYASDIYTEEQGTRLFAIIATGGALGAIFGPRIAMVFDTFALMLVSAVLLFGSLALLHSIERGMSGHAQRRANKPLDGPSGFALVLNDRTLLLIAGMLLVANFVNSTGEYILSNAVRQRALELVPPSAHPELSGVARTLVIAAERRELIKTMYSELFVWMNALTFLIQAFLVSRMMDKLGVRRALYVLPVIAFGAYAAIGLFGGLAVIRVAKIAENSVDYSLQNTVRQALFLPARRAVKYKAKAVIDCFFVRLGDMLSAILIGLGIHSLDLSTRDLAMINLGLVVCWVMTASLISHCEVGTIAGTPVPEHTSRAAPAGRLVVT